jgi:hypothetical protein
MSGQGIVVSIITYIALPIKGFGGGKLTPTRSFVEIILPPTILSSPWPLTAFFWEGLESELMDTVPLVGFDSGLTSAGWHRYAR